MGKYYINPSKKASKSYHTPDYREKETWSILYSMIGYIEGKILHKDERVLILLVNGVGYTVAVTPPTLVQAIIGDNTTLWTHLAVREDALDLYGFVHQEELALFRLLIGVSGIGPKSALNVLSLADVSTLARAIASGDGSYLTKVSGIGKKIAEKIVLELKEKMNAFAVDEHEVPHAETEALDALEALGYSPRDTRELVRVLAKEHTTTEAIIRKALQTLGGRS